MMKNRIKLILMILIILISLNGCKEAQANLSETNLSKANLGEADFSAVNQVDIQGTPFAFVELPSMSISEIDDPLNNQQTAKVIDAALNFIFDNLKVNQFISGVSSDDKPKSAADESVSSNDNDKVLKSIALLSVVMDSEDNTKITALLTYAPSGSAIEKIPVEVNPSSQFANSDNHNSSSVLPKNDSDQSVIDKQNEKIKAVLFLSKNEDRYTVEDYKLDSFY